MSFWVLASSTPDMNGTPLVSLAWLARAAALLTVVGVVAFCSSARTQDTVPRTRPDGVIEACDDTTYKGLTVRGDQVFLWVNGLSGLNEAGNGPDVQQNVATVKKIALALQQKNIALMPVLVPQKEFVLRETLAECAYSPYALGLYASILKALQETGLKSPNLEAAFRAANNRNALYLHGDFHWDGAGVTFAAKLMAKQLQKENTNAVQTLPKTTFKLLGFDAPVPLLTSLAENLPANIQRFFPKENMRCPKISSVNNNDLLGEKTVGIALVGTSFSLAVCKSLSRLMGLELSRDVYDYTTGKVGFWDSMYLYLRGPEFKKHPPKILIWEMPAYQFVNYPHVASVKPRQRAEQEALAAILALP